MIASQTDISNRRDFNVTFTSEFDKNQTAKTIVTPTTGKKIKVTGIYFSTEGAAASGAKVRLYFSTSSDTIATIYVTNAVQNTSMDPIYVVGGVSEPIKMTCNLGDDKNFYLALNYREE